MTCASRSWSPALGAAAALLAAACPAGAVGLGETEPRLTIREELYLVVHDPAARRQHTLYAARLEPGAPGEVHVRSDVLQAPTGALLALPAPAAPEVEVLADVDLAAALHAISKAHEALAAGRAPAPPAPWSTRGAAATATPIDLSAPRADPLPFDAAWLRSHAEAGSWLAALSVAASREQLEIQTPTLRVSFASEHPVLSLREPAPAPPARAADDPSAPRDGDPSIAGPYRVSDVKTEPGDVAPSAEVVARVLRTRTAATRACYDALLERRDAPGAESPSGATSVDVAVTISRRGEIRSVEARSGRVAKEQAEPSLPDEALDRCVAAAVRAKGFPRVDQEWRFTARVTFEPPRARARRTHILLVSAERGRWFEVGGGVAPDTQGQDPPPPWRLVRELEPTWDDIEAALPQGLRAKIGLTRRPGRLWAAQYLDASTDRRRRSDRIWKPTGAIPAPFEPGTRAFAEERARARTAPPDAALSPAQRGWIARSPRRVRALTAALVAAAAVLLALHLGRERS